MGPSAVLLRTSYASVLASAGFVDVEAHDLTAEYRSTQHAWIVASRRLEPALRAEMGDAAFERRLVERELAHAAIEDGVLERTLYSAVRP